MGEAGEVTELGHRISSYSKLSLSGRIPVQLVVDLRGIAVITCDRMRTPALYSVARCRGRLALRSARGSGGWRHALFKGRRVEGQSSWGQVASVPLLESHAAVTSRLGVVAHIHGRNNVGVSWNGVVHVWGDAHRHEFKGRREAGSIGGEHGQSGCLLRDAGQIVVIVDIVNFSFQLR